MLFATAGQGRLFIWMMAAGALIGAWYMICALIRCCLRAGFWLGFFCDLLFGAGSAVIFIAALVSGCYGQLRLFEIFAAALGAALFLLAAAPPARWLRSLVRRLFLRIKTLAYENRLIKVIFK